MVDLIVFVAYSIPAEVSCPSVIFDLLRNQNKECVSVYNNVEQ